MAKKHVSIGCPRHGKCTSPTEYVTFKGTSYEIADVSCAFCKECVCYYSTSMALSILSKPRVHGFELRKGIPIQSDDVPEKPGKRTQVHKTDSSSSNSAEKEQFKPKPKRKEFKGTTISSNEIYLSNVPQFLLERRCPACGTPIKRKNVRISHEYTHRFWITDKPLYCPDCNMYFLSPTDMTKINEKVWNKLMVNTFIRPLNIEYIETDGENVYCTTYSMLENQEQDSFYIMSPREIAHLTDQDDFTDRVPLKSQSILGERGYSVRRSPAVRRSILKECVDAYGKDRVIGQIRFNIRMREAQKENSKYANAIATWNTDIEYVQSLEDTWAIRQAEEARRMFDELNRLCQERSNEMTQQEKDEHRKVAWWMYDD